MADEPPTGPNSVSVHFTSLSARERRRAVSSRPQNNLPSRSLHATHQRNAVLIFFQAVYVNAHKMSKKYITQEDTLETIGNATLKRDAFLHPCYTIHSARLRYRSSSNTPPPLPVHRILSGSECTANNWRIKYIYSSRNNFFGPVSV